MTLHEDTIAKIQQIQQLPEPLIQEISDFVDFLLLKSHPDKWQLWKHLMEEQEIAESDFSDYLPRLEEYENLLAEGKVQC